MQNRFHNKETSILGAKNIKAHLIKIKPLSFIRHQTDNIEKIIHQQFDQKHTKAKKEKRKKTRQKEGTKEKDERKEKEKKSKRKREKEINKDKVIFPQRFVEALKTSQGTRH